MSRLHGRQTALKYNLFFLITQIRFSRALEPFR
jgi:hypothetical protein